MYDFGTIVLVPFPFTDLTIAKVRPALIVSAKTTTDDIILCFITSNSSQYKGMVLDPTEKNGLKIRSIVRFDKILTLDKKLVLGELGRVERSKVLKHKKEFFEVFGFGEK